MSYADNIFINNCNDIIENGIWDTNYEVRPKWEDGTPAHTVKKFCIVNRYDLSKEFPILTIRRTYLKSAIDELLWIWQKKSNIVEDLNSRIWDSWTTPTINRKELTCIMPVEVGPFFDTYKDVIKINELEEHDKNIEKESNHCGKYFKIKKNENKRILIQFVNTGNIMDVSERSYSSGKIYDCYSRTVYNVGYRGNYKKKELLDYFGEYFDRWCDIWRHVVKRCTQHTTKYYEMSSISPYFQSCENFLTWVMNNNIYGKDALCNLCIDKDYNGSKHYSEKTCTLLYPEDNSRLTRKKWFFYDNRYFFSRNELAIYLKEHGNNFIIRMGDNGNPVSVSHDIDKFIQNKIKINELKIINPYKKNENGLLPRFLLKKNGSIGKAYGYQLGIKHHYKEGDFDQVDRVIYDLKNNPHSRRIITNIYNHEDLNEMNLYPCAYSMTFNVSGNKLNGILNQRSQDMLAANNWNVCQYSILLMMFAHVSGLEVGELVHVIADAHIYDRHIPIVQQIINNGPLPAPILEINKNITDFYKFTPDDFILKNYNWNTFDIKIPIAE